MEALLGVFFSPKTDLISRSETEKLPRQKPYIHWISEIHLRDAFPGNIFRREIIAFLKKCVVLLRLDSKYGAFSTMRVAFSQSFERKTFEKLSCCSQGAIIECAVSKQLCCSRANENAYLSFTLFDLQKISSVALRFQPHKNSIFCHFCFRGYFNEVPRNNSMQ